MEDAYIIELYFARNEDAIQQTDVAYGRKLHCLADRILHNSQDSEEAVSDTYMKTWETIPPKRPAYFYAYLAKICRFFALCKLDWKAAAKRKAEVVSLTDEMAPCIPDQRKEAEFEDSMELLTEPITMQSLAGYVSDATGDMDPLYEYFTITSAILHPEGLALVGTHAFDFPEEQATVVMKDESEIVLTGLNGAPYCSVSMSQLKAESAVYLAKVDYVLLPDGTKLVMPS